jgi:hypothetical protein
LKQQSKQTQKKKKSKKEKKRAKKKKKDQSKKFPCFVFEFYQKAIFFEKYFTDEKLLLFFSIFAISSVQLF